MQVPRPRSPRSARHQSGSIWKPAQRRYRNPHIAVVCRRLLPPGQVYDNIGALDYYPRHGLSLMAVEAE